MGGAPGVYGLAEEGVSGLVVEEELGDIGAAEDNGACLAEGVGDGAVFGGDGVFSSADAEGGGEPFDLEGFFEGDGHAVEGPADFAMSSFLVGAARGGEGFIAEDGGEGSNASIDGLDAVEVCSNDLFRGDVACGEECGELGCGSCCQVGLAH